MAELELVSFGSTREAHQLMAETNAEHRHLPEQFANRLDGIGQWFRIAGTVR